MLSTELFRATNVDGKHQGAPPPTKLLGKETESLDTKRNQRVSAQSEAVKPQCHKRLENLNS